MLERASALAGALEPASRAGAGGAMGLRLGENPHFSLVQIAGFASTFAGLQGEIASLLGGPVPQLARTPEKTAAGLVFRTGHAQLWVIGPERSDLSAKARAAIPAGKGVVTDLSSARTRLFVEGEAAASTLAKGIPLDLDPGAFPVGTAAMTGVHHVPILLHRPGERRFDIYVMRTFALFAFEWLADAALEFGYRIETEAAA
ncbi:MAG: sarcosine oxidase subunit gamma family protein [Hyphomicrobiaceae bacterium]